MQSQIEPIDLSEQELEQLKDLATRFFSNTKKPTAALPLRPWDHLSLYVTRDSRDMAEKILGHNPPTPAEMHRMFSIKNHVTCVLERALARQELLVHGQRATTVKVIGHSPDLAAFSFNLLDDDGKFLVQTHIQDAIILNDGLGEGVTLSLMWAPGARDVATLAISGKRTPEPEFTRVEHGQTIGDPEVPLVVQSREEVGRALKRMIKDSDRSLGIKAV